MPVDMTPTLPRPVPLLKDRWAGLVYQGLAQLRRDQDELQKRRGAVLPPRYAVRVSPFTASIADLEAAPRIDVIALVEQDIADAQAAIIAWEHSNIEAAIGG